MSIEEVYRRIKGKAIRFEKLDSTEKAFLELFYLITTIGEYLVIHSKQEIDSDLFVELIREEIKKKL